MGIRFYKEPRFEIVATGWGVGVVLVCLFGFAVMFVAEILKAFGVG